MKLYISSHRPRGCLAQFHEKRKRLMFMLWFKEQAGWSQPVFTSTECLRFSSTVTSSGCWGPASDAPPSGSPGRSASHRCAAASPGLRAGLMAPRTAGSPAAARTPLRGWAARPRCYTASPADRRWPCNPGRKCSLRSSRTAGPSETPARPPPTPRCAGWPSCSHILCCSPHAVDWRHRLGSCRRSRGTPPPQTPAGRWWCELSGATSARASGSGLNSGPQGPGPAGNEAPPACRGSCGPLAPSHTNLRRSRAAWGCAPSPAAPPSGGTRWSGGEPRLIWPQLESLCHPGWCQREWWPCPPRCSVTTDHQDSPARGGLTLSG